MPDKVVKQGNKYRLMHKTPKGMRIAKTNKRHAVDGGGHSSRAKAQRQANARNAGRR